MSNLSLIFTDLDYEKAGKQIGWLQLPHSVTRSAYGTLAIPIACIKNGSGPTAFLMAGNHGDEYEGQVALAKLIRALDPAQVQGRVIIMPAANMPAAMAGTRVSPIDDVNMNRAFPGDPNGTPTRAITHYIDSVIFPMADIFHDLHSGGSSLDYVPFVSVHKSTDPELSKKNLAAMEAFGAEYSLIWEASSDLRFSTNASMKHGVVTLGSEFGGGGSVNVKAVKMVERGLRNLLRHVGIMEGKLELPEKPTRLMGIGGRDDFVYAPDAGLFEPLVELGSWIKAGQPCGQVHFVDNPGRAPEICHFRNSGMVICQRHFGRVERGDCVAHLANDR
jgi:predicted deacylase